MLKLAFEDLKSSRNVRMLVDTRSTYLLIPPELAEALGGAKLPERIPTTFANGGQEELDATALVLELEERRGGVIALIRKTEEPLLGVEGPEALGLRVDPDSGRLEPSRTYAARA